MHQISAYTAKMAMMEGFINCSL